MNQFASIMWARGRITRHEIASIRHQSRLKVAVVSVAAAMLWIGLLIVFWRGFILLRHLIPEAAGDVATLGDLLMARLLSVFALALFFMLIFSNVLIAFSTLYKAKQVQYLLQAPMSIRTFFLAGLVDCIAFSSWGSAYLGSPLIIAYGITTDAHWTYYIAGLLFYVPFVTIPAAVGATITLVLTRVFPRIPRVMLFVLAGAAVVWLFTYLRGTFSAERMAEETIFTLMLETTAQTQWPLLPSYWAAQGVLDAANQAYANAVFLWLVLVANALFAVFVATELANVLFLPGFSAILGMDRTQLRPIGRGLLGRLDQFLAFLPEPIRPLVVKDLKLFWRDPTQWTQFVVFFGIMAVYVANLGNNVFAMEGPGYRSFVSGLNSASCLLILASLTSRFVFPLVSLEGFRFWIVGLAPITRRQLIWQKYWLSVLTTTPFSVGLILLSNWFLQVDPVHFAVSVYAIILANLALSGLAVGLGSLYPNFEEDNPARIVSGMGGTLNFLLSVGYLATIVIGDMAVFIGRAGGLLAHDTRFAVAVASLLAYITLASAVCVVLPMRLGMRNIEATEF